MKYILSSLMLLVACSSFSQKHVKFRAGIDAAVGFGNTISSNAQTVGNAITTVTLGAALKGFSLGAGTGLFKMHGTKSHDYYIPVYGEISYLVQKNKAAPFFGLRVGKLLPQKEAGNPYPELDKPTMMYNPSVGLAIDVKILYIMPFLQYFVPADFNSRFDTFGIGLRVFTH